MTRTTTNTTARTTPTTTLNTVPLPSPPIELSYSEIKIAALKLLPISLNDFSICRIDTTPLPALVLANTLTV